MATRSATRSSLIMSTRFSPSAYSEAAREPTPSGFRFGLPPTADRLVERDQLERDVALGLCERVLRGEERFLGHEHGEEVGETLGVQVAGELRGAPVRAHRVLELVAGRLLVREGDERVLDVLERLQHDALVRREELLLRRRLERDVGPDAPALEDRPGVARGEGEEPALPVVEVRAAGALLARD